MPSEIQRSISDIDPTTLGRWSYTIVIVGVCLPVFYNP